MSHRAKSESPGSLWEVQAPPTPTMMDALFDVNQPGVYRLFAQLAREIKGKGFDRYSADAILHQIRWQMHIDKGDREFTVNNNWSSVLARRLMRDDPTFANFFETRQRKSA